MSGGGSMLETGVRPILEPLVAEELLAYFRSAQWAELQEVLTDGSDALHAHAYTDSILHPHDVASVIEAFFSKRGKPLQREIRFLSHGRGVTNIYNIHPRLDAAHFEVFMTFNESVVLEAATGRLEGHPEVWSQPFMQTYYDQFAFRALSDQDESEIRAYFRSEHWQQAYEFMMDSRSLHCHVPVTLSAHPESVMAIGQEAIAEKGWIVGRAVSIVYRWRGIDQGKIVFLLKQPEIVLELEWEFDPGVLLGPRHAGLTHLVSDDQFLSDVAGIPYYRLSETIKQHVIERV